MSKGRRKELRKEAKVEKSRKPKIKMRRMHDVWGLKRT
jgi:hypothetical protein